MCKIPEHVGNFADSTPRVLESDETAPGRDSTFLSFPNAFTCRSEVLILSFPTISSERGIGRLYLPTQMFIQYCSQHTY